MQPVELIDGLSTIGGMVGIARYAAHAQRRSGREVPREVCGGWNMTMRNNITRSNNLADFGHLTFQPLYTEKGKWYFCSVES